MTRLYSEDAEYIRALEQERDAWASRHASLERELAELREAARADGLPDSVIERVLAAWPKAFGAISASLSIEQLRAVQEMDQAVTKLGLRHEQRKSALLPAASEPAKEPSDG